MCRVDSDDIDCQFYSSKEPRARKQYKCDECRRAIPVGEKHRYTVGKWDGMVQSYRTCAHCHAASTWLQEACGGYVFMSLLDELAEHDRDEPQLRSDVLTGLIAGMRAKWHAGADPIPDVDAVRAAVPETARA